MEVDLRSENASALDLLEEGFRGAVDRALTAELTRWRQPGGLEVATTLVGDRPAGRTGPESPLLVAAIAVTQALALPVWLEAGSTDANLPMSLDVPAITIEGGGRGTDAHALGEAFDTTDSWKGTQRATLLAIAMTR